MKTQPLLIHGKVCYINGFDQEKMAPHQCIDSASTWKLPCELTYGDFSSIYSHSPFVMLRYPHGRVFWSHPTSRKTQLPENQVHEAYVKLHCLDSIFRELELEV